MLIIICDLKVFFEYAKWSIDTSKGGSSMFKLFLNRTLMLFSIKKIFESHVFLTVKKT